MHELAIMEAVVNNILEAATKNQAKKVVAVQLRVGDLRDFVEEWMQSYFRYCTYETIAEGARLEVIRNSVEIQCTECGKISKIGREELLQLDKMCCKLCNSVEIYIISGQEFAIERIAVI